MSIIGAFMVPHPPLIIPEIGRGEEKKIEDTVRSYDEVGCRIKELSPETIVILSPHNLLYGDYFHIRPEKKLQGSFTQFGAGDVSFEVSADTELVERLNEEATQQDMPWGTLGGRGEALDHGTLVPLYFIRRHYREFRMVSIGLSGLPLSMHYRFGQALRKALDELGRKAVIIASGDLSHYLKEDGPYGFRKEGPQYDEKIMEVMGNAAFDRLLGFSDDFCEKAGECGHRAFTIMAGALDGMKVKAEKLSYEGVFGVGYGICAYEVAEEDPYVALARESLETYVKSGSYMEMPEELPEELISERTGAFVSIHKQGQLRGCIGTIGPVQENLAIEIIANAVSAGTQDPRFLPITEEELDELDFSVDVLGKPEPVDSIDELDVKKYGVIVTKGMRRGLLLPDLDGIDTPQQQVAIAAQKAGLSPDEKGMMLERFRVIRHGEK